MSEILYPTKFVIEPTLYHKGAQDKTMILSKSLQENITTAKSILPISNSFAVRERSLSVKQRRFGAPVLPELQSEVTRDIFLCGSQTNEAGSAVISSGSVKGTELRASSEVRDDMSIEAKRSA